ncbi:hypothetical protein BDBG_07449 [Blastomyces gilchristii SLH14081]|uniref:Uncharacterized protein n=1 Tax=Blastomyces gilchristii (strain SLH14081) TaxID=559298 RepID=A0A179UW69_BLAGS|nr:uncharacterized protein BDBG_07449 [Blastomyces gilchristii SLH14081]OAT12053.1 hypothetical protein BDBG_07449 [Blastomyces gilchristii SLH14081]
MPWGRFSCRTRIWQFTVLDFRSSASSSCGCSRPLFPLPPCQSRMIRHGLLVCVEQLCLPGACKYLYWNYLRNNVYPCMSAAVRAPSGSSMLSPLATMTSSATNRTLSKVTDTHTHTPPVRTLTRHSRKVVQLSKVSLLA